ncbi:hypothetical protein DFH07DRAFT_793376 [Mycena maculata]|uniref:Extracellular conserved serine-rich protein n=1 Tax=Mycena maculata TaxID=230809 RepID=A0AAD7K8T4_9AGAR|nr:hypothetical protein DFH07DRAFT_793376 [Mycena maculata]
MFAMFKLCVLFALAAPFASALTITSISGNVVSEGSITIDWTTSTSDAAGTFSIELDHPSFNSALAIANNVDSSSLSITVALPNVPAQDGYTIEFVAIDDVNTVFSTSSDFAIGAVSATQSTTVTGASNPPTSSSASTSASKTASGSGSAASVTLLSTKAEPSSTTNTGFGTTASATSPASGASSAAPSTTGSSGALAARSIFGGSVSGALLVALGVVAGAFAL